MLLYNKMLPGLNEVHDDDDDDRAEVFETRSMTADEMKHAVQEYLLNND
jgi:hypothetical protein